MSARIASRQAVAEEISGMEIETRMLTFSNGTNWQISRLRHTNPLSGRAGETSIIAHGYRNGRLIHTHDFTASK